MEKKQEKHNLTNNNHDQENHSPELVHQHKSKQLGGRIQWRGDSKIEDEGRRRDRML